MAVHKQKVPVKMLIRLTIKTYINGYSTSVKVGGLRERLKLIL